MTRLRSAGARARLGDFTTDLRVLVLVAMAVVVGAGGVAAAWVLLKGIALVTNLVWFQTVSTASISLAGMTAIFGTPIAAVLLAVELLLFEWKPRSLIPVLTACALAAVLRPYVSAPDRCSRCREA